MKGYSRPVCEVNVAGHKECSQMSVEIAGSLEGTDMPEENDRSRSDDDGRDDEHRPDEVPPKEPPGRIIRPRPSHGSK